SAFITATLSAARADNWDLHVTADNQFDLYYGSNTATTVVAGAGSDWQTTYDFLAPGRATTDYLYIAASSDQYYAQGLIGSFTNLTTATTINTGNQAWQVFAAGAYAATNPFGPGKWPANVQPTRAQVDTAIAYASANNLWVVPDTNDFYFNGGGVWDFRPNIPANAQWIWH